MRHKDFACLILSHGRADNVKTYKSLRKCGYTGKIYILVDNEDACLDRYIQLYGDQVIVFNKKEAAKATDKGDLNPRLNSVVFARNMCHKIAKDLGLTEFLELDDDYREFQYRYQDKDKLRVKWPKNLDAIFDAYLDFLAVSNAHAVCFMQGGDLIGGLDTYLDRQIIRKAMNVFFCRVDRPFKFAGRMNDDVNTYVLLGHRGALFFSFNLMLVIQEETQQQQGGLTDIYLEFGTYAKSFYTVMMCPSAVKISSIRANRDSQPRFHHRISWNNCTPKILPETCRKI